MELQQLTLPGIPILSIMGTTAPAATRRTSARGQVKVREIPPDILTLPLFCFDGQPVIDELDVEEVELDVGVSLPDCMLADQPVQEGWTLDGMLQLHSVLLEQSIRALGSRGNPKQKRDVLDWVFRPREVKPAPFSFQLCCELEGMDQEVIQSFVERALSKFFK